MFKAKKKVPLSQAPGKTKVLVAIPGAACFWVLSKMGFFVDTTRFLAFALCAYAAIGVIEILCGQSLANAAQRWEQLPGWKKFLVSLPVIVAAIVGFALLIPVFAGDMSGE